MRQSLTVAQTAARGKPPLRTSALAFVSLATVVVGLLLVAPAQGGDVAPVETKFVGQLRAVSGEATAAQSEIAGLKKSDKGQFRESGERLLAATGSAIAMLRTYRGAQTRFGTDEEYELVTKIMSKLRSGVSKFRGLTGDPVKVKPRRRAALRQELEAFLEDKAVGQVVKTEVGMWLGAEAVTELVNSKSLKDLRNRLGKAVATRVRAEAKKLAKRTIGFGLDIGAPLAPQLRALRTQLADRAREAAARWLARAVFNSSPSGLVMQFVGRPLVRFVESQLKKAFRGKGALAPRTMRTLNGFAKHHTTLENSKDDDRLGVVRRRVARAENAIAATSFLKGDLKRAAKPRRCASNDEGVRQSCEAAQGHRDDLNAGVNSLQVWISNTRARFLLDSKLANADFDSWINELKRAQRQLRRMIKNLPKSDTSVGTLDIRDFLDGGTIGSLLQVLENRISITKTGDTYTMTALAKYVWGDNQFCRNTQTLEYTGMGMKLPGSQTIRFEGTLTTTLVVEVLAPLANCLAPDPGTVKTQSQTAVDEGSVLTGFFQGFPFAIEKS